MKCYFVCVLPSCFAHICIYLNVCILYLLCRSHYLAGLHPCSIKSMSTCSDLHEPNWSRHLLHQWQMLALAPSEPFPSHPPSIYITFHSSLQYFSHYFPCLPAARPIITINLIPDIVITGQHDQRSVNYINGLFYAVLMLISSEYTSYISRQMTINNIRGASILLVQKFIIADGKCKCIM